MKNHCAYFSLLATLLGLCVWSLNPAWAKFIKSETKTVLNVSCDEGASRVFNFNPLAPNHAYYTNHFIFEPLIIYDVLNAGKPVFRLASSLEVAKDHKTLTFELREGIQWSDGHPFTAEDVLFTWELLRRHPSLDRLGLIDNLVVKVRKDGPLKVVFKLTTPNLNTATLISQQPIVPKHQFSKVKDPVNFKNPHPIGTGPFTEVELGKEPAYSQCRNPHYWQQSKLKIDCLHFPYYQDIDALVDGLRAGKVDWSGAFIPDIQERFVNVDPLHHHYWLPPNDNISLYLNTTQPPLDNRDFRVALSMAINRKKIVEIATYGQAYVSHHPTGLGELHRAWYDREVNQGFKKTGKYLPFESEKLLNLLGYLDQDGDGLREDPRGNPLKLEIAVVKGWSDWETAVRMVAAYFREIGLSAGTRSLEFNQWLDLVQKGQYQIAIGWGTTDPHPWTYYYKLLSPNLMKERAEGISWSRWKHPDSSRLLDSFHESLNPHHQHMVLAQLQKLVGEHVPIIPLFSNPSWYQFNSSRFTGWATADDPFVRPMCFSDVPERLLHVLRLKPRNGNKR